LLPSTDIKLHESMVPPERVFLNNDEAARFLNLSPRTLEKQRVIGGGPRFRKFGRRVLYAVIDLEAWANERTCESTSDPYYGARR
jgi:Helix-turn-helix domain